MQQPTLFCNRSGDSMWLYEALDGKIFGYEISPETNSYYVWGEPDLDNYSQRCKRFFIISVIKNRFRVRNATAPV